MKVNLDYLMGHSSLKKSPDHRNNFIQLLHIWHTQQKMKSAKWGPKEVKLSSKQVLKIFTYTAIDRVFVEAQKKIIEDFVDDGLLKVVRSYEPVEGEILKSKVTSSAILLAWTIDVKSRPVKEHPLYQEYVKIYRSITGRKKVVGDRESKIEFTAIMNEGVELHDIQYALERAMEEVYHIETNFKYLNLRFILRKDKYNKYVSRKPVQKSQSSSDDFGMDSVMSAN
jgi:hypothetical protein